MWPVPYVTWEPIFEISAGCASEHAQLLFIYLFIFQFLGTIEMWLAVRFFPKILYGFGVIAVQSFDGFWVD